VVVGDAADGDLGSESVVGLGEKLGKG